MFISGYSISLAINFMAPLDRDISRGSCVTQLLSHLHVCTEDPGWLFLA